MRTSTHEGILSTVETYANTILEHGRDRYGDTHTPLFVDSLDVDTKEFTPYPTAHRIRFEYPEAVLANPATYQDFLRTLVGLTALTGEQRYRTAAEALCAYTLDELTDDEGLIQWGGHVAWDLETDEPAAWSSVHELKFHYPFYELMWEVDERATIEYIEAMWNAHVIDWAELDFNRHGAFDEPQGLLWENEYVGEKLFFMGEGLTFVNAGSDLYYAASMLARFTGADEPLQWAKRLAGRYLETRQGLGISGYQFSSKATSRASGPNPGTNLRGDRAEYQFGPYVHGDHLVREGTLFKPKPRVQRRQLEIGSTLGDDGEIFTNWALEELHAWAEHAYRPESNTFEAMLTDGFPLEGFVLRYDGYYGDRGDVVGPIDAGVEFFWAYAQAYRESESEICWETARSIADGLGLGDIGAETGNGIDLSPGHEHADYRGLYGLLELFEATGDDTYLDAATAIGEGIIDRYYENGLFVAADGVDIQGSYDDRTFSNDARIAITGDKNPLALLHLAAAIEAGSTESIPRPGGKAGWGY